MTHRALYLLAKDRLSQAGIDTPGFDAGVLARHFLGLDRPGLAVRGAEEPLAQKERAFLLALAQREERRPLQYIVGSWPFMGLELFVGEGVLVPREDTAVLVEAMAGAMAVDARRLGLDLCAGTGAVGLGLCSLLPAAKVFCVEKDSAALAYLHKNLAKYSGFQAEALEADVLDPKLPENLPKGLDFIAANPPYIESGDLPGLQPAVRREPAAALDGGPDGLVFYRAITSWWARLLRPGGLLGVEIGSTQGQAVKILFEDSGFQSVQVRKDLGGLDRVVLGKKMGETENSGLGW